MRSPRARPCLAWLGLAVFALASLGSVSASVLSSSQLTKCVVGEAIDGTPSSNAT